MSVFILLLTLRDCARSRALQLEILALRHQLHVLERSQARRLRLTRADRLLGIWLSRVSCDWRTVLRIVKLDTVIGWHRRGFRLFRTWKSRHRTGRADRPSRATHADSHYVGRESAPGAPRIH
jgi:hypothetical protein